MNATITHTDDLQVFEDVITEALELGQRVSVVILDDDGYGNPAGRTVHAIEDDGRLLRLDPAKGETVRRLRGTCEVDRVFVDGRLVLVASSDG